MLFAGQLTGLEGYVAAVATGLVAGLNAAQLAQGKSPLEFPRESATGALLSYMVQADPANYFPTAFMLSMLPPAAKMRGKRARHQALAQRAKDALDAFIHERLSQD